MSRRRGFYGGIIRGTETGWLFELFLNVDRPNLIAVQSQGGLEDPSARTCILCKDPNRTAALSIDEILSFFFLLTISRPHRGYVRTKKLLHTLRPKLASRMVREVGFEPTNPYGTGASGLRVQDPHSRRVSLTWLGNTSRPTDKADSRKHQARSRKDPNPNDAPN